jgi:hypothetical protein
MALYLEPPGRKDEQPAIYSKNFAWQVIKDNLREFDVECVGGLAKALRSQSQTPQRLGSLDFISKRGAERAVAAVHETKILRRLVWLKPAYLTSWKVA